MLDATIRTTGSLLADALAPVRGGDVHVHVLERLVSETIAERIHAAAEHLVRDLLHLMARAMQPWRCW